MTNDWIIDVLTDIQEFSRTNSLGQLADRLDETIAVASRELSAPDYSAVKVNEFEQDRGHAGSALASNNP